MTIELVIYPDLASCEAALALVDESLRFAYQLGGYLVNAKTGLIEFAPGRVGMEKWDDPIDLGDGRWGFRSPLPRFEAAAQALLGGKTVEAKDLDADVAGKQLSQEMRDELQLGGKASNALVAMLTKAVEGGQIEDRQADGDL